MYTYVPKVLLRSKIWSLVFVLCGAAVFGVSYFIDSYKSAVQLAALVLFVLGIWIACRYVLIGYYYSIDGENFRIIKVNGKKEQLVCNISMRTGYEVFPISDKENRKHVKVRYNYSRNIMPKDEYIYYFEWNGAD
ncbi:MAG: hypothetical protein ACI4QR_05915, partial [Eubacteriales bacterium]